MHANVSLVETTLGAWVMETAEPSVFKVSLSGQSKQSMNCLY